MQSEDNPPKTQLIMTRGAWKFESITSKLEIKKNKIKALNL